MAVLEETTLAIRTSEDIVRVRQATREKALQQGFNLIDQTKLVTAASELARNTLEYGRGGDVRLETMAEGVRKGVRMTFIDQGPGIPDIGLALQDGYTSGKGLGLGLSGARRLCSEFSIESKVGSGTQVMIARWR